MNLCTACHRNQPRENRKVCDKCLAKLTTTNNQRRLRLVESGICYTCGKNPAVPDLKRCAKCNAKDAARRRKIVAERRTNQLCVQCGAELDSDSTELCRSCIEPRRNGQRERRLRRKAAGICIECDQPICEKSKQFCEKHWSIYNIRNRERYFDGLRQPALERDNYTCQLCGAQSTKLDVHHIDLDRNHNELDNLITLCSQCHRTITHLLRCKNPQDVIEFVKVRYLEI